DPVLQALAQEFAGRAAAASAAPRPNGAVPALHHAVAPRAPRRAPPPAASSASPPPPAAVRARPEWPPTALLGDATPAAALAPVPVPSPAQAPSPPPRPTPKPPPEHSAGHVPQPTAWSRDTSGFGFSRPQDWPENEREFEPAPFVPTADALRPSATPPDISWATALRNRPEPVERPGWKLAFWRKS
ncbi:MAG: hypothetical protein RJA98_2185, partial [Pseudomonadota bacterium]